MSGLIIIIIGLMFLLSICFVNSRKKLLTPQFCLVACFLPQVIYALFWVTKWELNLVSGTVFVYLFGLGLFVLVSIISYKIFRKKNTALVSTTEIKICKLENYKLLLFLALQLVTFVLVCLFLIKVSGGLSLSLSIAYVRDSHFFGDQSANIPGIVNRLRGFSVASGYVWAYLFVRRIVYRDKNNIWLLLFNFIASCMNSVIMGSRGTLVNLVIAAVFQYYFIIGEKQNWSKNINYKMFIRAIVLFAVIIIFFQRSVSLLGRETIMDPDEYISAYLSAELCNLNAFICTGNFGANIYDCQTLGEVVNFIGSHFGVDTIVHEAIIPFRRQNGYYCGNVYTMFYPFLYDLGYWGLIVFIPIMAVMCQYVYCKAISKTNYPRINGSLITYTYILSYISMSFFHEKFYATVFSMSFIWNLIFWWLTIYFLEKLKLIWN